MRINQIVIIFVLFITYSIYGFKSTYQNRYIRQQSNNKNHYTIHFVHILHYKQCIHIHIICTRIVHTLLDL
jgi:hypothetical protein